ncbi:hypothetical protein BDZ94DRAFT_1194232 [Collybia nuda]|uniref:CCHC-type domain-containing protein n=1 Tax=Collybia nuda TaxID=64659 RepID=A0A9P6CE96_9AGAR|nr:hypothetical protein BDZ94DRAFT_1194232 [Collybia nuda]
MAEVIDLTDSPPIDHIIIDADVGVDPGSWETTAEPQLGLARDGEKKKTRRKKRKRPMVEGDRLPDTAQTRETSMEGEEVRMRAPRQGLSRLSNDNRDSSMETELESLNQPYMDMKLRNRHGSLAPCRVKTPPLEPRSDDSKLFFIDVKPAPLPTTSFPVSPAIEDGRIGPSLLLPAHVSVFGTTPLEILPSPSMNSDGDDYIDYLDFDDRKDVVRYFQTPINETAKRPRMLCKHCGVEGDHRTSECLVLICLTCGARNEHPTRSCPISKTCFSCGMKGHINSTCPNRRKGLNSSEMSKYDDCGRCGSYSHQTNECPTLWRLYEYFTDQDKDRTICIREERKHLNLGQGGEGYIANDEWCYNCGNCGHWGDDCQDLPHNKDMPNEQSAFGIYNLSSGPFYNSHSELVFPITSRREPRDWEQADGPTRDDRDDIPGNVGRQARQKNILRMKAQEKAVDDDPDDWFGGQNSSHKLSSRNYNNPSNGSKKISFGKSLQAAASRYQPPARMSLLDRLGDNTDYGSPQDQSVRSRSRNESNSRRDDKFAMRRDRDKYHSRESGPRYKGGYRT